MVTALRDARDAVPATDDQASDTAIVRELQQVGKPVAALLCCPGYAALQRPGESGPRVGDVAIIRVAPEVGQHADSGIACGELKAGLPAGGAGVCLCAQDAPIWLWPWLEALSMSSPAPRNASPATPVVSCSDVRRPTRARLSASS